MKIEFLYPELCMYGDRYNINYLKECNKSIEVINTSLKDKPHFTYEKIDMVYLGSLDESSQLAVIKKLKPYTKQINKMIEDNKVILLTGSASEIFGKYIERNNEKIEALNIFDYYTTYNYDVRYHDLYLGEYEDINIIGFKCQYSYLHDVQFDPLFKTIKGLGNNHNEVSEGIRVNNFMATSVLGPLFIYNPLFVKKILALLKLKPNLKYEKHIMEAYENKLNDYLVWGEENGK